MTNKLNTKVAIVTGASSGIGEATAVALAAEGVKVTLVARRADRLEQLTKQISESGGQAISIIADLTDEMQVRDMVFKANAYWCRIDIFCQ